MIPRTSPQAQSSAEDRQSSTGTRTIPRWQRELAEAVHDVDTLLELVELQRQDVGLPPRATHPRLTAEQAFRLRVPRSFVQRMRPGDPRDPLLLQVLAQEVEMNVADGFSPDPLQEVGQEGTAAAATEVPGLLHKYHGRALLVLSGACAVHCRYCFRRHFPYGDSSLHPSRWRTALDYLAGDSSIEEVLLSGGDPLSLRDESLAELAAQLQQIPHLRRLRVHSRQPIVLPSRVDDQLLAWLAGSRLLPIVVVHANHPREIDADVKAALRRLRQADVTVLNQAVLLRGVNDDVDTLVELGERLFEAGTLPYYLNLLDPVQGAHHFAVPDREAQLLYGQLLARTPGYLVPKLVREIPGAGSKMPAWTPP